MGKIIKHSFKEFNTYGIEELNAASRVIKSGVLSDFIANKSSSFSNF